MIVQAGHPKYKKQKYIGQMLATFKRHVKTGCRVHVTMEPDTGACPRAPEARGHLMTA